MNDCVVKFSYSEVSENCFDFFVVYVETTKYWEELLIILNYVAYGLYLYGYDITFNKEFKIAYGYLLFFNDTYEKYVDSVFFLGFL